MNLIGEVSNSLVRQGGASSVLCLSCPLAGTLSSFVSEDTGVGHRIL